jgi:hypothetical protein
MKPFRNLTLAVLVIATSSAFAQTKIDLRTQSKTVDFSSALSTKTSRTGTALPATCGVGESFFKTNAPAGQNLYGCTATNAWSVLAGSSSSTNATQLQSKNLAATVPTNGQALVWNNPANQWEPQNQSGTGTNATQLQFRNLASTAPADGQAVVWNAAGNTWQPATVGGASSFGRFNISAMGSTSLTFGTDCATFNCSAGPINNPTTFTSPMVISSILGAASAIVGLDLGVSPARGKVVLDAGSASVSGMGGVAVAGTVPADMVVLYTCSINSGTFASCTDNRGFTAAPPVTGHSGVVCTPLAGATDCVIDSAQVPTLSAVPVSSSAACSPPQFAADAAFYYICTALNTWRRVAVSSF